MLHDDTVMIKFIGTASLTGKAAVMVRRDAQSGDTGCATAAALSVANSLAIDHGGELLLQPDGFMATTVRLPAVTDGRTETLPGDNDHSDLSGTIHPSSTYDLCLANVGYTQDSDFTHYAYIQVHVQVCRGIGRGVWGYQ